MFERFGKDARRAVVRARHEAVRARQDRIGCEHLLIGVFAEPGPAAQALAAAGAEIEVLKARMAGRTGADPNPLDAEALASLGIDLDAVRRATDAAFGPGSLDRAGAMRRGRLGMPPRILLTPEGRTALELAVRGTVGMKQSSISTGHVLVGIIDQADNTALELLAAAGVDAAALRADLVSRMTAAA